MENTCTSIGETDVGDCSARTSCSPPGHHKQTQSTSQSPRTQCGSCYHLKGLEGVVPVAPTSTYKATNTNFHGG
jgi:hypothetical protein